VGIHPTLSEEFTIDARHARRSGESPFGDGPAEELKPLASPLAASELPSEDGPYPEHPPLPTTASAVQTLYCTVHGQGRWQSAVAAPLVRGAVCEGHSEEGLWGIVGTWQWLVLGA